LSTPIASRRRRAPAVSTSNSVRTSSPKAEFKQIFEEGWRNQRDYLYVQNQHGADWPKVKELYSALLPLREPSRRSELRDRHDGLRDRHRSLVRARRRHA
jgi:hypothetical protein